VHVVAAVVDVIDATTVTIAKTGAGATGNPVETRANQMAATIG
jgi:hypothetical protein